MKKRIISVIISLLLCLSLGTSALAAESVFDPTVTINRETVGKIIVTVNADNAILSSKQPALSVPCTYTYAQVTGPNGNVAATVADGMVSFTVAAGGTYTVQQMFAVTFDANGGACGTAFAPCDTEGKLADLPTPTRSGYWYFNGWYTEASGGSQVTEDTVFTQDTTIYAQWYYDEPYYEPYVPPTTTEKSENEDGSVTTTVTNNRTGTVTETTETADGTTVVTETAADGTVTTEVTVSESAARADEPVVLPIPAVEAVDSAEKASPITVNTVSGESACVEIPVAEVGVSTVVILVNEDGTETTVTTTKTTETGVAVEVPDGATVKVVDNFFDFKDVDENDWEQEAVKYAAARGLVNGVGNDSFDLDGIATRGQVMTLLARLAGVDTTPGEGQMWYDKGREWAMANGISDGTFLDRAITRDEMMTMLWRYVGSPESDHDISHFTDAHELDVWTEEAARWAVEVGLVGGHGNGTMTPKAATTRGQLAQFMMNFIQLM